MHSSYASKVRTRGVFDAARDRMQGKPIDRSSPSSPAGTYSSGAHILREAHPIPTHT